MCVPDRVRFQNAHQSRLLILYPISDLASTKHHEQRPSRRRSPQRNSPLLQAALEFANAVESFVSSLRPFHSHFQSPRSRVSSNSREICNLTQVRIRWCAAEKRGNSDQKLFRAGGKRFKLKCAPRHDLTPIVIVLSRRFGNFFTIDFDYLEKAEVDVQNSPRSIRYED